MLKSLVTKWQLFLDKKLSRKILNRLESLDRNKWLYIGDRFNRWEFPIEFYDLIPKWYMLGCNVKRAMLITSLTMQRIRTEFGYKEELRAHNVGMKMTNDEFDFWYDNVRGSNNGNIDSYYDRVFKMEEIHWWEDAVWAKISEHLISSQHSDHPTCSEVSEQQVT